VLEAPLETDDGAGGKIRGHVAVTTLWAQVLPQSARPEVDADAAGAMQRFAIVIRARSDVTTRHRFVESGRIYRIRSARESADRRFLTIEADVRAD
jgi:SPP1 family predicted phage head-tail adaptor